MPLAAFGAVFLWGGPPSGFAMDWGEPDVAADEVRMLYAADAHELARRRWPMTPAMLDGAQPDLSPKAPAAPPPCATASDGCEPEIPSSEDAPSVG